MTLLAITAEPTQTAPTANAVPVAGICQLVAARLAPSAERACVTFTIECGGGSC
jgi:hypothetical protein